MYTDGTETPRLSTNEGLGKSQRNEDFTNHMTNSATSVHRHAFGVREAAQSCGLSERHIRNLIAQNELKAIRSGRRVLITEQALLDYLHRQAA